MAWDDWVGVYARFSGGGRGCDDPMSIYLSVWLVREYADVVLGRVTKHLTETQAQDQEVKGSTTGLLKAPILPPFVVLPLSLSN